MNYAQVVETCCRDLRRYLESALKTTRGGVVSVKMRRLLRAELPWSDRMRYAMCLSRILRPWRWGDAYVIPRQDATRLLETFDKLCESVRRAKRRNRESQPRPPPQRQEMIKTTLLLPSPLLRILDEYAREKGMTRSDAIRYAIQLLILKHKGEERCIAHIHDKPLARVSFHLPLDLLNTLDEYVTALQTTRASIVRYAIARMLKRITEEVAPLQVAP